MRGFPRFEGTGIAPAQWDDVWDRRLRRARGALASSDPPKYYLSNSIDGRCTRFESPCFVKKNPHLRSLPRPSGTPLQKNEVCVPPSDEHGIKKKRFIFVGGSDGTQGYDLNEGFQIRGLWPVPVVSTDSVSCRERPPVLGLDLVLPDSFVFVHPPPLDTSVSSGMGSSFLVVSRTGHIWTGDGASDSVPSSGVCDGRSRGQLVHLGGRYSVEGSLRIPGVVGGTWGIRRARGAVGTSTSGRHLPPLPLPRPVGPKRGRKRTSDGTTLVFPPAQDVFLCPTSREPSAGVLS